jgi:hypothetical protein
MKIMLLLRPEHRVFSEAACRENNKGFGARSENAAGKRDSGFRRDNASDMRQLLQNCRL